LSNGHQTEFGIGLDLSKPRDGCGDAQCVIA
jgi:hypothetical protein